MSTPRPWRLPRGKPRVVRTPVPAKVTPPRIPTPVPPSWSSAPIAFQTLQLGGLQVLVSADVLRRFPPALLTEALLAHGYGRGSRQTKHRFKAGTFTVLSNPSQRRVVMVNPSELRILQPPKRPR